MSNPYDYYEFKDIRSSENLNKREPYVFTVTATNSSGTSSASTPTDNFLPIVAPGVPTNVTGTNDDGKSVISFTPGDNGGDSKVIYTVNTIPGAFATSGVIPVSGTSSPITVSGLKNGAFYTFTVTASNSAGTSQSSSPSATVYPAKQLSNLIITNATSNENGKTTVSYTIDATDAGIYAVSIIAVQKSDSTKVFTPSITLVGNNSPVTITGLTNGVEYNVTASATSTSYPNNKINSNTMTIIPSTIPDMPSNLLSTSVDNGINISFKIPPNNGSNIQKYTLRPYYTTVDSSGNKSIKCDTPVTITDPAILNATSGSTGSYTFSTTDRTKTFDTTAFPPSTTTFPKCSTESYSYVPLKKNKKTNYCWFVFLIFIIVCFFILFYRNYRNKKF